jgi:2'-5' RNA ligase
LPVRHDSNETVAETARLRAKKLVETLEKVTGKNMRLFVALQPTEPVRATLAELAGGVAKINWTPPRQFHLTLRFIGEVSAAQAGQTEEALARVRVRPFFLELEGVGGFPPRGRPQVLWAGVRSHPLLHQLRQQVDDFLLAADASLELRPFVPHFTLGRCGEAPPVAVAHWLKRRRDFAGPVWPVDAFYLMSSEPAPAGVVHRVVRRFPLGTAVPQN